MTDLSVTLQDWLEQEVLPAMRDRSSAELAFTATVSVSGVTKQLHFTINVDRVDDIGRVN